MSQSNAKEELIATLEQLRRDDQLRIIRKPQGEFEAYVTDGGQAVLKMLHVIADEQQPDSENLLDYRQYRHKVELGPVAELLGEDFKAPFRFMNSMPVNEGPAKAVLQQLVAEDAVRCRRSEDGHPGKLYATAEAADTLRMLGVRNVYPITSLVKKVIGIQEPHGHTILGSGRGALRKVLGSLSAVDEALAGIKDMELLEKAPPDVQLGLNLQLDLQQLIVGDELRCLRTEEGRITALLATDEAAQVLASYDLQISTKLDEVVKKGLYIAADAAHDHMVKLGSPNDLDHTIYGILQDQEMVKEALDGIQEVSRVAKTNDPNLPQF